MGCSEGELLGYQEFPGLRTPGLPSASRKQSPNLCQEGWEERPGLHLRQVIPSHLGQGDSEEGRGEDVIRENEEGHFSGSPAHPPLWMEMEKWPPFPEVLFFFQKLNPSHPRKDSNVFLPNRVRDTPAECGLASSYPFSRDFTLNKNLTSKELTSK